MSELGRQSDLMNEKGERLDPVLVPPNNGDSDTPPLKHKESIARSGQITQSQLPTTDASLVTGATGIPTDADMVLPASSPAKPRSNGHGGLSQRGVEASRRQREEKRYRDAIDRATGWNAEEAAALQEAEDAAPKIIDQVIDIHLAPARAFFEFLKGVPTGVGKGLHGLTTFVAAIEMKGERATLKRFDEIDAGDRPRFDDNDRVKYYFARKEKRQEERQKLERDAAVPLEERWLYKNGKAAGDWFRVPPGDERYKLFYDIGGEIGKGITAAPMFFNPVLGTVVILAMETGDQTNDAIKDITDASSADASSTRYLTRDETDNVLEFNQRGVLRNSISNLPITKIVGAAGGNYVVRVIQGKVSPRTMKALSIGSDALETAGGAAVSTSLRNADAHATFDPDGKHDEDPIDAMLVATMLNLGKVAVRKGWEEGAPMVTEWGRTQVKSIRDTIDEGQRIRSNLYVEPMIAKAEVTTNLANKAADLAQRVGSSLNSARTQELHYDPLIDKELGAGRKAFIRPDELQDLIDTGHFAMQKVDRLKLREKIAKARESDSDVELSLKDLIKADAILSNRYVNVMNSLRFERDGPTGKEARPIVAQEDTRLKAIEDRLKNADPATVVGGYAFKEIRLELRKRGLPPAEASRQAARRVAVYEERASEMSAEGRYETVDTVYLRDEYRKTQTLKINPSSKANLQREDEHVTLKLREYGIAMPTANPSHSGPIDKFESGQVKKHRTRQDRLIDESNDDSSHPVSP